MSNVLLTTVAFLISIAIGAVLCGPWRHPSPALRLLDDPPTPLREVGIGTVCGTGGSITVEVETTSGQRFTGRLRLSDDDASLAALQPGVLLLVTFDPTARERVSLADDMVAVRTAFDQMLVRKGIVTPHQLDLIRNGTRARGVVTAMRATGVAREDYREVELDLMVRRPAGGQFPARETALVPVSGLPGVTPGSVVELYYRRDDESSVAVCVPPG